MNPLARAGLGLGLAALTACNNPDSPHKDRPLPKGVTLESEGVHLRPESERLLDFFIIGIEADLPHFFILPPMEKNPGVDRAVYDGLRRELYMLNFELSHGAMMRVLPGNSTVFVAVPEGKGRGPIGIEKEFFRHYLKARCGWSDAEISKRLRFFRAGTSLVWMQDAGEILGRDAQGRAVIRVDKGGREEYHGNIKSLVKTYPQYFQLKETSSHVRAEGGDEELVWLPDGNMGLLVGRNRVTETWVALKGEEQRNAAITPETLEEIRTLFSQTFYSLPVHFVPEKALLDPGLANEELFHLDMIASVLKNDRGAHAFVPEFGKNPMEATSGEPLDRAKVKSWGREYDLAAKQLESIGYKVLRLPLLDHPARSPTNVIKYFDLATQKHSVFLGRYPDHLPDVEGSHPQKRLREVLWALEDDFALWMKEPDAGRLAAVRDRISQLWDEMAAAASAPNPGFEKQAEVYRSQGYEVIAVPLYPGGSGGLHCMVLQ